MAAPSSSQTLAPAPTRTPIIDSNGNMTFSWAQWYQSLYQRIGGGSTDPLNQVNAKVTALTTRVTAAEAHLGVLDGEISTIDGQISTLNGQVSDLETRVAAIEATLSAGINATITTAALTPGGTQGSMTFVGGILTAEVQAT